MVTWGKPDWAEAGEGLAAAIEDIDITMVVHEDRVIVAWQVSLNEGTVPQGEELAGAIAHLIREELDNRGYAFKATP